MAEVRDLIAEIVVDCYIEDECVEPSAPSSRTSSRFSPAPALASGERTGAYKISAEDYAVALLDEIKKRAATRSRSARNTRRAATAAANRVDGAAPATATGHPVAAADESAGEPPAHAARRACGRRSRG